MIQEMKFTLIIFNLSCHLSLLYDNVLNILLNNEQIRYGIGGRIPTLLPLRLHNPRVRRRIHTLLLLIFQNQNVRLHYPNDINDMHDYSFPLEYENNLFDQSCWPLFEFSKRNLLNSHLMGRNNEQI
jgi:hypothetical protein